MDCILRVVNDVLTLPVFAPSVENHLFRTTMLGLWTTWVLVSTPDTALKMLRLGLAMSLFQSKAIVSTEVVAILQVIAQEDASLRLLGRDAVVIGDIANGGAASDPSTASSSDDEGGDRGGGSGDGGEVDLFCVNKVRVTCCCYLFRLRRVCFSHICRHTPPMKMCSPLAHFFSPPRPLTHFPRQSWP